MAEPLTTSIATAIVAGAASAVSDGVRALITKLASLVRERFRRTPSDQEILESAVGAPRDHTTVLQLAEALERHMRNDPTFARNVRALWMEIQTEAGVRDQVTNVVSGQVHGNVVQARDVQGGISFGAQPSPLRE